MRPAPAAGKAPLPQRQMTVTLSSELPEPLDSTAPLHPSPADGCDFAPCRWRPYTASNNFDANAVVVLIMLLCGLICGLALNTAIRCCLRPSSTARQRNHRLEPKCGESEMIAAPPATTTYSPAVKLAGTEAVCAICLTEFVDGDRIRVLEACSHGFHAECIDRWMRSHASCPTCRSSMVNAGRCPSSEAESVAARMGTVGR